ncbi:MAG: superoxide dismutase [Cyclobacteriaceae bacterium]|nr:superoxide dismutase [Cyclobacteriaceae bacterium]
MEKPNTTRRNFLLTTVKAGLVAGIGLPVVSCSQTKKTEEKVMLKSFSQAPLGYAYNALEPVIDAMTMEIHYSRHHAAYVNNLNKAMEAENIETESLESLMGNISTYSTAVRNNGGGHYNHDLFWKIMSPGGSSMPTGALLDAINASFDSYDNFKEQFSNAALTRFGSGWGWLVENNGKLLIGSTPNQDNPLMDLSDFKGNPLLGIDVWEHAYYLKYQNRRGDYINAFFDIINWDQVSARLNAIS